MWQRGFRLNVRLEVSAYPSVRDHVHGSDLAFEGWLAPSGITQPVEAFV
jgi:hypothetical protein